MLGYTTYWIILIAGKAGTGEQCMPGVISGNWGISDNFDMLEDALKNTEQVIFWSVDPNTSAGGYYGQETVIWRHWLRDLGIKRIFIDPFCNYTAAHIGEKWIAPRPGTDAAWQKLLPMSGLKKELTINGLWKTVLMGFEEFKKHILGEEDGILEHRGWAAEICDVPAHTITALAREWAAKKTMLACGAMYGSRRRLPGSLCHGMGKADGSADSYAGTG